MTDDLVYKIFVELAVLEGKRDLNGAWTTKDVQELGRLLRRAYMMVARAAAVSEDEMATPRRDAGPGKK